MPGGRQIFPEYCHLFQKKNGENNPLPVIYFEKKNVNHETLHRIRKTARCKLVQKRVSLVFTTFTAAEYFFLKINV